MSQNDYKSTEIRLNDCEAQHNQLYYFIPESIWSHELTLKCNKYNKVALCYISVPDLL